MSPLFSYWLRMKFSYLLPFVVAGICVSCTINKKLDSSLVLAKENRKELEKVLKHYSQDRLKYQAACFLIENMKDCYWLEYAYGENYIQTVDSLCQTTDFVINDFMADIDSINKKLNIEIKRHPSQKKYDLEYMTANELICHIDLCFEVLRYPWAKNVTFTDFCEYILPYRIGYEKFEDWMGLCRNEMQTSINQFIYEKESARDICYSLVRKSAEKDFFYATIVPDMSLSSLLDSKIGIGNCKELQALSAFSLRSLGIPVAIDFTPQWAKRSTGHGWCTLVGVDYQIPFLYHDKVLFGEHLAKLKQHDGLAKVYRRMYSEQDETLACLHPKEEIPPLFEDKHLKDVSEYYFEPMNVVVAWSVAPPKEKEYAYLAVFDNKEWIPIDWGKIKNKKVRFQKIAKGNVYLVIYFHHGKTYPASAPFIVEESGNMKFLISDKSSFTTVCLKRKYPDKEHVYELAKSRTIGGKFQTTVGDSGPFIDIYTINRFPETLAPTSIIFNVPVTATAFRYLSAPNSNVYLAELEAYDEYDELIEGEIIGTDGSWHENGRDKYKVFDHNMLTYFDAPVSSGGWVGLSFGRARKIKRIVYAPYNDDNGINRGELYELFYFDKGWVSLGEKYGDNSYTMKYEQVPRNSLLLLRNKVKGNEVRIFTQEDGKHKWW